MKITAYLHFNGTCAEAISFYEQVFNGKVVFQQTFGESPMKDDFGPEVQNGVMHATLQIGDDIIHASDAPPGMFKTPQGFSLSYATTDTVAAERIFAALAEGGNVFMPLAQTFWAERFGMVTDRFGTPWMINCDKPA